MSESETFCFATCERWRALGFLKRVYPSATITDTPDSAGPLLDLVERDIVRIQDPMMHGDNPQVIQGKKWDDSVAKDVLAVCKAFHDSATRGDT